MAEDTTKHQVTRESPRAVASLEVDVDIAGETRKVLLLSRDIGAGGMFLRTKKPAEKWTRIELVINTPDGGTLSVGGEVVRSVDLEQAEAKGQAPGMAVAFDEVSRKKRKELLTLVLDLCSRRPTREERESRSAVDDSPAPETETESASEQAVEQEFAAPKTDDLLGQLDDILDDVETAQQADSTEDQAGIDEAGSTSHPDAGQDALDAVSHTADDGMVVVAMGTPHKVDQESQIIPADVAPENEDPPEPEPEDCESDRAELTEQDRAIDELRVFIGKYTKVLKGDTHYDVLLLGRGASHKQISVAYKKLLHKLKPPGPPESLPKDLVKQLSSVLGKIRKAFAILAKPDRKRAYDFLIDND